METSKPQHPEDTDVSPDVPEDQDVTDKKTQPIESDDNAQQANQPCDEECDVPDDEREGFDPKIKHMMERKSMHVQKHIEL